MLPALRAAAVATSPLVSGPFPPTTVYKGPVGSPWLGLDLQKAPSDWRRGRRQLCPWGPEWRPQFSCLTSASSALGRGVNESATHGVWDFGQGSVLPPAVSRGTLHGRLVGAHSCSSSPCPFGTAVGSGAQPTSPLMAVGNSLPFGRCRLCSSEMELRWAVSPFLGCCASSSGYWGMALSCSLGGGSCTAGENPTCPPPGRSLSPAAPEWE